MMQEKLHDLNSSISELEVQIKNAKAEAEDNIKPLKAELSQIKREKTQCALKNDFDSVEALRRREENLKFKISAQWNSYTLLKEDLTKLKARKSELEAQIKLENDRIKKSNEIKAKMDVVLKNYKKTQSLKQAALDSGIRPEYVEQWYEWGDNNFNETYSYFYTQKIKIDNYFKELEAQKLRDEMDCVIKAYKKTGSLKEASEIADVSYDTVTYWYEWGSRGFGDENKYFFSKIKSISVVEH